MMNLLVLFSFSYLHSVRISDTMLSAMKYEITDITYEINNESFGVHTVHKIRALKDFGDVKKGDLGGWIEGKINLSQVGNCWVYDDSIVFGTGGIIDDATVSGHSIVYGHSHIGNSAKICGGSTVKHTSVDGHALVDSKSITSYSNISDNAVVKNSSIQSSEINGNAYLNNSYACACTIGGNVVVWNANISEVKCDGNEEIFRK